MSGAIVGIREKSYFGLEGAGVGFYGANFFIGFVKFRGLEEGVGDGWRLVDYGTDCFYVGVDGVFPVINIRLFCTCAYVEFCMCCDDVM